MAIPDLRHGACAPCLVQEKMRMMPDLKTIRTDVVGSLLRPAALKEARMRFDAGQMDAAALHAVEDDAVRQAVALQEAAGLDVVSDGETRRLNFQDSFGASVEGYDAQASTLEVYEQRVEGSSPLRRWDIPRMQESGTAVSHRRPAKARLRLARNVPLEEYRFVAAAARRPAKVSLIGPDRISQRFDYQASTAVYRDMDDFLADVVAIERAIIASLAQAGCRYVQIDAPGFTAYVDPPSLAEMRSRGEDPMQNFVRSLAAEARLVTGFADMTFGIHLCRGNQRSMWHREGSYDAIAERLFNTLPHDRFLLEYDSPRAGSFEPLRFVPKGKVVVLGLISTKVPQLETIDDLRRRIGEASKYLALEQLAVSPQCGFASDVVGNLLSEDDQKRKLELVAETARQVWG
jgi:5-methyltetrahydropteroyltriglutamate--homocysteine methyltransferase